MSWGFAAVMIAVVSVVVVLLLSLFCASDAKRFSGMFWPLIASVVVPFTIANCLYWSPVVLGGADPSGFWLWAPLFLVTWFLAGAVPSVVLVLVIWKVLSNTKVTDHPK
jgi:hypothetical protein